MKILQSMVHLDFWYSPLYLINKQFCISAISWKKWLLHKLECLDYNNRTTFAFTCVNFQWLDKKNWVNPLCIIGTDGLILSIVGKIRNLLFNFHRKNCLQLVYKNFLSSFRKVYESKLFFFAVGETLVGLKRNIREFS